MKHFLDIRIDIYSLDIATGSNIIHMPHAYIVLATTLCTTEALRYCDVSTIGYPLSTSLDELHVGRIILRDTCYTDAKYATIVRAERKLCV